jgi:hypothetical protein
MNKTYLWLGGMLVLGALVGVAGAAFMAKQQAAAATASPSATS